MLGRRKELSILIHHTSYFKVLMVQEIMITLRAKSEEENICRIHRKLKLSSEVRTQKVGRGEAHAKEKRSEVSCRKNEFFKFDNI